MSSESKKAEDFLKQIDSFLNRNEPESTRSNASVTFNMRIAQGLKDDFDKLCRDNHTNMTAEVKRFIRLAVEEQRL